MGNREFDAGPADVPIDEFIGDRWLEIVVFEKIMHQIGRLKTQNLHQIGRCIIQKLHQIGRLNIGFLHQIGELQ